MTQVSSAFLSRAVGRCDVASINSIAIQVTVIDPPRIVAKDVSAGLKKIPAPAEAPDSKITTTVLIK